MALVSAVVSCAVSRFPFCAGKGLSPRPPAPSLSHHSHGVHRLMCKDLRLFPLPFVIFVGTVSGLPHFPSNPDAMFCHHFASPISDPYIVVLCEHRAVHAAPILLLLLFLFLGPPLLSSPLAPLFYVTPSPSLPLSVHRLSSSFSPERQSVVGHQPNWAGERSRGGP